MKSRCYWSDSTALGFQHFFHCGADLVLDLSPWFQPRSGGIIKPGVPTPGPRRLHSIPLQIDSFIEPKGATSFPEPGHISRMDGKASVRARQRTQRDDVAPVRGLGESHACEVPGAYAPGYTMSPVPGSENDALVVNEIRGNIPPAAPGFSSAHPEGGGIAPAPPHPPFGRPLPTGRGGATAAVSRRRAAEKGARRRHPSPLAPFGERVAEGRVRGGGLFRQTSLLEAESLIVPGPPPVAPPLQGGERKAVRAYGHCVARCVQRSPSAGGRGIRLRSGPLSATGPLELSLKSSRSISHAA